MHIITIGREFGSGGRELGKRLADAMGYDYYDREIISAIAKEADLDADYVENALQGKTWSIPLTFRQTLGSTAYPQSAQVSLLLKQKDVIEKIAALGRDCIIVGRNADVILRDFHPFCLFVCATAEAKLRRCRERAPQGESLTDKEMLRRMKQIDKVRRETRALISGSGWGKAQSYHLTVNTTDLEIKALISPLAEFAKRFFEEQA